MGSGGGSKTPDETQKDVQTWRSKEGRETFRAQMERQYELQGGAAKLGKTKEQWVEEAMSNIDSKFEAGFEGRLGSDYIDPKTGDFKNRPPTMDSTDKALAQARTSAYQRLQLGKNRQSSFAVQGKLGGFDVGKPVLGGY
jgi:hypothetical protein